ncbi:MAG: 3-methyl-2-oxobutanoate hydroxymethyltransferase [Acidimicrobiales bacterium]
MTGPVTVPSVARRKRSRGDEPIVVVTAYDEPFARFADKAGVDVLLVGDSVADNVLGYENTLQVDVAQLAHHVGAVARARPRALVVADLPWMSYHLDPLDAVRNAATLVRAGAKAVKLEGGRRRLPVIHALLDAEIPVMGHLGLTPQSVLVFGEFRVQGRAPEAALALELDAKALDAAGVFAVVLEGVPDLLAERITESVEIPTIGIGAGPHTDGQVLVIHDLLGMSARPPAKFVRRYAELGELASDAIGRFAADVRSGSYPSSDESYHASGELAQALEEVHRDDTR